MADWPYSTAAWQRLRRAKLSLNPLCETCEDQGRITPATDVDHIKAIRSGGHAFPEVEGLRSLCHSCHSRKTNAVDHPRTRRGCDENGLPLDPTHPFLAPIPTPLSLPLGLSSFVLEKEKSNRKDEAGDGSAPLAGHVDPQGDNPIGGLGADGRDRRGDHEKTLSLGRGPSDGA